MHCVRATVHRESDQVSVEFSALPFPPLCCFSLLAVADSQAGTVLPSHPRDAA